MLLPSPLHPTPPLDHYNNSHHLFSMHKPTLLSLIQTVSPIFIITSLLIKSLSNNLVIGQVSLVSTYLTTCRSNHPYPLRTLIPPSCHLLPLTRPFPHKSSLYLHMGNKGNMLLSALTQRPSSWLLMEAVWILIP